MRRPSNLPFQATRTRRPFPYEKQSSHSILFRSLVKLLAIHSHLSIISLLHPHTAAWSHFDRRAFDCGLSRSGTDTQDSAALLR